MSLPAMKNFTRFHRSGDVSRGYQMVGNARKVHARPESHKMREIWLRV